MNPINKDIRLLMISTWSVGVNIVGAGTDAWGIALNREMPHEHDRLITVYSLPGRPSERVSDISIPAVRYPSFQVRVRGRTNDEAYSKILAIQKLLEQQAPVTLPGATSASAEVRYMTFVNLNDPAWLKMDDKQRHYWVATFRAIRKERS
jgi:hypothetical protein